MQGRRADERSLAREGSFLSLSLGLSLGLSLIEQQLARAPVPPVLTGEIHSNVIAAEVIDASFAYAILPAPSPLARIDQPRVNTARCYATNIVNNLNG